MRNGTCCQAYVLPSTEGQSGIAEVKTRNVTSYTREFHAWGLFKGLDGQPEAQPALKSNSVACKKCSCGTARGPWSQQAYDPRPCNRLMLKNKHIDLAIKRDDSRIKIPGGVN